MGDAQVIKARLSELGEDFDSLTPKIQELLYCTEDIFSTERQIFNQSMTKLQHPSLNIFILSERLGCSRTTIYKNNCLRLYIEKCVEELEESNPFKRIEKQQEALKRQQKQLELCFDRDIDTELLKQEICIIEQKLIEKNEEIEQIRLRNLELSKQLITLRAVKKQENTSIVEIFL